jgi:hypothetical protein
MILPTLFIEEFPTRTPQVVVLYGDGRKVCRNITPLTAKRLTTVFTALQTQPTAERTGLRETLKNGIRALQSLDDLGEDANRQLAYYEQILFEALRLTEAK